MAGGATVIPSNTTARVHESMRGAELHPSEKIGAIGAIGMNEDEREALEPGVVQTRRLNQVEAG